MRAALSIVCVMLVAGEVAAAPALNDLDKARRSFKAKDWSGARTTLKDLLYPSSKLGESSDIVEAHVLLGLCHYEEGNIADAKREFEEALEIDPFKRLEPEFYSEGQVRLFNEVRADVEARAERDRKLREIEEERERLRRLVEGTQAFETRSRAVNFAPFGAGQFQNGHRTKGILVASGQGATLLTSAGIFLYLAGTYGLEAKVPLEDAANVRRLQQIQVTAGALFFAIYAYSIIDGNIYFKPRVRTEVDPALLEELKKKRPKTSKLQVGPMLLPGGAGVGISWESD